MRCLPLVYKVPVAGSVGVDWSRFEHGRCHAAGLSVIIRQVDLLHKWAVHDISVTGDPSDVGHARKLVVLVDIKHVLYSQEGTEEVTSCRVDDTLWLSS